MTETLPTLLIATARTLGATFSLEDLIVEAWKRYPMAFGMGHYWQSYPDSRRVHCCIYGGPRGMREVG